MEILWISTHLSQYSLADLKIALIFLNVFSIFSPRPWRSRKRKKRKRKKTYQQVSKPCLYCKIPSAKPISFQEKKNLILFLNSNKCPRGSCHSLEFLILKRKARCKVLLWAFNIYLWHSLRSCSCLSQDTALSIFLFVSCPSGFHTLGLCTEVRLAYLLCQGSASFCEPSQVELGSDCQQAGLSSGRTGM